MVPTWRKVDERSREQSSEKCSRMTWQRPRSWPGSQPGSALVWGMCWCCFHDKLVLVAGELLLEEVVGFSSGSPVVGLPASLFNVLGTTGTLLSHSSSYLQCKKISFAGRNTTGELSGEVRYQGSFVLRYRRRF